MCGAVMCPRYYVMSRKAYVSRFSFTQISQKIVIKIIAECKTNV